MSDIYEFPNDPEEQEEAKKEEAETLALFVDYARVPETAGARKHFERNENNYVMNFFRWVCWGCLWA